MDYIPHDEDAIKKMLTAIGIIKIDELFRDVPSHLLINTLELPAGLSEADLLNEMLKFAGKNKLYSSSFLGAGCYYHYIPSIVDFLVSRSEFYTSYTPYQAEASQGYLQAIYEYQTIITSLTQMDVANASMYDGSTALAEAGLMATSINKKSELIVIDGVHPEYIEVLKTYCWAQNVDVKLVKEDALESKLSNNTASVIFQSPNFFGDILSIESLTKKVRNLNNDCLIIQVMTDPTCLGLLTPPGSNDIDIFVAEGQALGIEPSFGGPGLGIFATKEKYLRKMPGRLVGKTRELHGDKEGFILTLQAREQHIRREKASSNICTNQALCAFTSLIYLLCLGEIGLREVAKQNVQKSHFLKQTLMNLKGYQILNKNPTYNEFLLKCPDVDSLINGCKNAEILPPLRISKYFPELDDVVLVCVTELNSKSSIDQFIEIAKNSIKQSTEDA
jgi:glycine dehydrogenase subunit 1